MKLEQALGKEQGEELHEGSSKEEKYKYRRYGKCI